MSNIIDISARITNALPVVKITDDIIVTVNNRKSVILNMQLLVKEMEKKSKKNEEGYDEIAFMEKVLTMLIGKKSVDAVNDLDLPYPEYQAIYEAIMGAATGKTQEEAGERFQK